jgi:hypothetical protein
VKEQFHDKKSLKIKHLLKVFEMISRTNDLLLYAGAIIIFWGVAHIIPTKNVVHGFGSISEDNKKIITQEWIAEGLTMVFIGFLVLFITFFEESDNSVSLLVYRLSALMIIIMAGLTLLTGARTSILPMKICPFVKIAVAAMLFLGIAL